MNSQQVFGVPFFTSTKTKMPAYSYLNKNITTDVLIIGGGIDGAICAYFMTKSGIKVTVVDKLRFGYCSTSVATALLEYQLDAFSQNLKPYMTDKEIAEIYSLGKVAISNLESIIKDLGNKCNFSLRPTLVFTTKSSDLNDFENEYKFRKKFGHKVELITEQNNSFPFKLKYGIFDSYGGAEINPYLFTSQLLKFVKHNGGLLFENTEITNIEYSLNGAVATTKYGNTITCKKVICATGYDTSLFSEKPLCEKYLSYTIVTSPIKNFSWKNNTLLHDNVKPYHYIRLSHDNRIIFGGEDTKFSGKYDNKTIHLKYKKLETDLYKMFPLLKDKITIDYKFCGVFGTTKNNVGVYGPAKNNPHLYYMLGYGANGIINCLYTAQMLVDLYFDKTHPLLYLFSPDREIY